MDREQWRDLYHDIRTPVDGHILFPRFGQAGTTCDDIARQIVQAERREEYIARRADALKRH